MAKFVIVHEHGGPYVYNGMACVVVSTPGNEKRYAREHRGIVVKRQCHVTMGGKVVSAQAAAVEPGMVASILSNPGIVTEMINAEIDGGIKKDE